MVFGSCLAVVVCLLKRLFFTLLHLVSVTRRQAKTLKKRMTDPVLTATAHRLGQNEDDELENDITAHLRSRSEDDEDEDDARGSSDDDDKGARHKSRASYQAEDAASPVSWAAMLLPKEGSKGARSQSFRLKAQQQSDIVSLNACMHVCMMNNDWQGEEERETREEREEWRRKACRCPSTRKLRFVSPHPES